MGTIWDYYCDICKTSKHFLTPRVPGMLKVNFVLSLNDMPLLQDRDPNKMEYTVEIYEGIGDEYFLPQQWGDPIETTELAVGRVNPVFGKVFSYNWTRGKKQLFRFLVKSKYNPGGGVSVIAPPAIAVIKVDDFVVYGRHKGGLRINLDENLGSYILLKETVPLAFKLAATNVPRKDAMGMGKSDPYVECYWKDWYHKEWIQFHKTVHIDDTENPIWDERIQFLNYTKGARDMLIKFRVLDYDPLTADDLIGETELPVTSLLATGHAPISLKISGDPKEQATLIVTRVPPSAY